MTTMKVTLGEVAKIKIETSTKKVLVRFDAPKKEKLKVVKNENQKSSDS